MSEYVEIASADGTILRGLQWRASDAWVLLIHDLGEDADAWRPLRGVLEESGCSRLAIDLRGHGASDGSPDASAVSADVDAAVEYANVNGAKRLSVITAGSVGVVVLGTERAEPFAAMTIFSPGPLAGRESTRLRGAGSRKLLLAGAEDAELSETITVLHQASIGWCYTVSFPTAEQGSALLRGQHAVHAKEHVASFIRDFAFEGAEAARPVEQTQLAGAQAQDDDVAPRERL